MSNTKKRFIMKKVIALLALSAIIFSCSKQEEQLK